MKRNDNPLTSGAERGMKSTLPGIFVNLGLALIKCLAGLLGDSFALVADGLESIMDGPQWFSRLFRFENRG